LDYAKDLCHWSYDDFKESINKSINSQGDYLLELVSQNSEDFNESAFIDNVSRNLKKGRFQLLIVGDGIREDVERITDFLQNFAHLNFSFALVEISLFHLPKDVGEGFLVQPRVIAQTLEIERAVVRVEGGKIFAETPPKQITKSSSGARRTKISEQIFFENLEEIDRKMASDLRTFFDKAQDIGFVITQGQSAMFLKSADETFNFATFTKDGNFKNYAIASHTENLGYPEIGEQYLEQLASLFDNAYVDKAKRKFNWTIKAGKNQPLLISEFLTQQDSALKIFEDTLNELNDMIK
jgi:hypothetical protein